eukprot:13728933-Alexandrium_andersonii.AAC.1
MCLCVCVCVRARARVRVRACARARVSACVRVCVRALFFCCSFPAGRRLCARAVGRVPRLPWSADCGCGLSFVGGSVLYFAY